VFLNIPRKAREIKINDSILTANGTRSNYVRTRSLERACQFVLNFIANPNT